MLLYLPEEVYRNITVKEFIMSETQIEMNKQSFITKD